MYTIANNQLNTAPSSNPGDAPAGMPRGLDIANSVFGWLGQVNNAVFSWLNPDQVSVGIGNQPPVTVNNPAPAAPQNSNTTLYVIAGVAGLLLIGGVIYIIAKKK